MISNLIATAARLAVVVFIGWSRAADGAEIAIYSAGAVKAALDDVAPGYAKATGDKLVVSYAPVGTIMRRLSEGAKSDIVVLTLDVMGEAEQKGWAAPGTVTAVGAVGIGVAIHEGAAVPDISTPEAFKKTLLAAKSITYIDPEKGTSGKHFSALLRRMGIFEAMQAKTTLGDSGYVVEPVARGEIELGIQQITEILPVKGAKLVGPLPEPLQKITIYAAAMTSQARDGEAGRRFLAYLRSPEAREVFKAKGFAAP